MCSFDFLAAQMLPHGCKMASVIRTSHLFSYFHFILSKYKHVMTNLDFVTMLSVVLLYTLAEVSACGSDYKVDKA